MESLKDALSVSGTTIRLKDGSEYTFSTAERLRRYVRACEEEEAGRCAIAIQSVQRRAREVAEIEFESDPDIHAYNARISDLLKTERSVLVLNRLQRVLQLGLAPSFVHWVVVDDGDPSEFVCGLEVFFSSPRAIKDSLGNLRLVSEDQIDWLLQQPKEHPFGLHNVPARVMTCGMKLDDDTV